MKTHEGVAARFLRYVTCEGGLSPALGALGRSKHDWFDTSGMHKGHDTDFANCVDLRPTPTPLEPVAQTLSGLAPPMRKVPEPAAAKRWWGY